MSGLLVVVSGPSGVGKNTLLSLVMREIPTAQFSISVTTRSPRDGEVDGRDYHFVSEAKFSQLRDDGALLESACVHNHYYGTPRDFVAQRRAEGFDIVMDIDVQGMQQITRFEPDAVTIFIAPPSFEELRQRLVARHSETPEDLERRLTKAREEMEHIKEYQYLIINRQGEQENAANRLKAVLIAEKCRVLRIPELPDIRCAAPK